MKSTFQPGHRCRTVHPIPHPGGKLGRNAEGTVLSSRQNLGRELITVGFDEGPRVVLFPHEIERAPTATAERRDPPSAG